ncbi:MAG: formylglycine-generating enzyme family protein [Opitutales bacterium]|nr:formylglycine-generating enzyme family protein [Opitutales bacterium]
MQRTYLPLACLPACILGLALVGCARNAPPIQPRDPLGQGRLLPGKPYLGTPFTLSKLDLEMRPIPSGTFRQGSPQNEPGRTAAEGLPAWVSMARPFWLGRTPVTHGQWRALMGTDLAAQAQKAFPGNRDLSQLLAGADESVAMYLVNWREAMEFCSRLNARARAEGSLPAGYEFTLPTEAQWEYACRAGTTEATYGEGLRLAGESSAAGLGRIAWYAGNSSVGYEGLGWDTVAGSGENSPGGRAGPRGVGLKQPNAWGLGDMLGNVYQWCRDVPAEVLPADDVTDPTGPVSGLDRVVRGGSWHSGAAYCRAGYRAWNMADGRSQFIGFRVALAPSHRD